MWGRTISSHSLYNELEIRLWRVNADIVLNQTYMQQLRIKKSFHICEWKKTNSGSVIQYQWERYRISFVLLPFQCMSAKQIVFSLLTAASERATGRTNGRDFSTLPLPLSSPPSLPPSLTCLQMVNATLDVFLFCTSNQRSQLHCS